MGKAKFASDAQVIVVVCMSVHAAAPVETELWILSKRWMLE